MAVAKRMKRSGLTEEPVQAFGVENPTREYIMELAATTSQSFCDTLISPVLADLLLSLNTHNRPIRRRQLANFTEIINDKRFINTGEPIIISRLGVLHEGQHRLTVVKETGKSAVLDIRVGIDPAAFYVTGTGAARSPGDVVALAKFSNPTTTASAAKLSYFYVKGLPHSFRWRLGTDLVMGALERWPDIEEAVRLATNLTTSRYFKNSSTSCFLWLALRANRGEEAFEFMKEVVAGQGRASAPAKMLYNLLTGDLRLRLGRGEEAVEKLALHLIAWEAWINKTPLPPLRWKNPQPFPVFHGAKL